MIAYATPDGVIHYGLALPEGAFQLAPKVTGSIRRDVDALAARAYDGTPLVPNFGLAQGDPAAQAVFLHTFKGRLDHDMPGALYNLYQATLDLCMQRARQER